MAYLSTTVRITDNASYIKASIVNCWMIVSKFLLYPCGRLILLITQLCLLLESEAEFRLLFDLGRRLLPVRRLGVTLFSTCVVDNRLSVVLLRRSLQTQDPILHHWLIYNCRRCQSKIFRNFCLAVESWSQQICPNLLLSKTNINESALEKHIWIGIIGSKPECYFRLKLFLCTDKLNWNWIMFCFDPPIHGGRCFFFHKHNVNKIISSISTRKSSQTW